MVEGERWDPLGVCPCASEPPSPLSFFLQLKKDYLDGLGDTLDLVVIGAYLGKGKRAGIYGGFLLACYDEESEEYQSICKVTPGATRGLGDVAGDCPEPFLVLPCRSAPVSRRRAWRSTTASSRWVAGEVAPRGRAPGWLLMLSLGVTLQEHVLAQPRPYYRWDSGAAPDRWLAAVQVWEVKCGDLSISPVYRAAVGLVSGAGGHGGGGGGPVFSPGGISALWVSPRWMRRRASRCASPGSFV